jgi:integrase
VLVPDVCQASFGDAWRTLRKMAKVDGTLRIHDLRHHVASDMAEAGVPGAVAMRLMGWVSPRVRKRYEHIQDKALREGMEQLQAMRDRRDETEPPKPPKVEPLRFTVIRGGKAG